MTDGYFPYGQNIRFPFVLSMCVCQCEGRWLNFYMELKRQRGIVEEEVYVRLHIKSASSPGFCAALLQLCGVNGLRFYLNLFFCLLSSVNIMYSVSL